VLAGTFSEKLLTYALGRGLEHYDMPAVRQIVSTAGRDNYRFASLVLAIVRSVPFQMRTQGES
jgi:predicted GTPase